MKRENEREREKERRKKILDQGELPQPKTQREEQLIDC